MKAISKIQDISRSLINAGIEYPDKEARIILQTVLNISFTDIYRDDPELTEEQISLLDSIVRRRTRCEPLQYILGHIEFMGLRMQIGKGVLIPRPETELMAEYAIKTCRGGVTQPLHIMDLCTGSGCLALALAKEFPDSLVFGTDISDAALSYARRNAENNHIGNVTFLEGSLFDSVDKFVTHHPSPVTFDLIISNPPYIKSDDIKNLQPEIKNWEPLNALDGGSDGLDYYRKIVPEAGHFLKDRGLLILELGIDCANAVVQMLKNSGFTHIALLKDLAGIERIAAGQWGQIS